MTRILRFFNNLRLQSIMAKIEKGGNLGKDNHLCPSEILIDYLANSSSITSAKASNGRAPANCLPLMKKVGVDFTPNC